METVAGELVRRDIIPEVAGLHHFAQQVSYQVDELLLCSGDALPLMHECHELGAVASAVVGDQRIGRQHRCEPLAGVAGLVMALATKWGLFRNYWVLFSFVLTILATVVVVLHMPTVSVLADVAQEAQGARLDGLGGDLFHPGLGLVVLLVIQVLNVYKPRGLTRYGWRKQYPRQTGSLP